MDSDAAPTKRVKKSFLFESDDDDDDNDDNSSNDDDNSRNDDDNDDNDDIHKAAQLVGQRSDRLDGMDTTQDAMAPKTMVPKSVVPKTMADTASSWTASENMETFPKSIVDHRVNEEDAHSFLNIKKDQIMDSLEDLTHERSAEPSTINASPEKDRHVSTIPPTTPSVIHPTTSLSTHPATSSTIHPATPSTVSPKKTPLPKPTNLEDPDLASLVRPGSWFT